MCGPKRYRIECCRRGERYEPSDELANVIEQSGTCLPACRWLGGDPFERCHCLRVGTHATACELRVHQP
jgi:hypothetical protein